MGTICAEQHKFHPSHQFLPSKKTLLLKDINIPPRKLLGRHQHSGRGDENPDMFSGSSDSPRFSFSEDVLLQKFLSYKNSPMSDGDNGSNAADHPHNDEESDDEDLYSSDNFRMYEFKVRRCTRSRSHDWTDCPFAHPGEKARRRDPRRLHYSGTVCPDFRRGGCSRGDCCEFAHGVFECWLHPARYRTEACKDGKNCKRKVCFFAHTPKQLRILPVNGSGQSSCASSSSSHEISSKKKTSNSNNCCLFCRCGTNSTSSPTSTLLGMSHFSPPLSPPLSPEKPGSLNGFSPVSRYNAKDQSKLSVLTELVSSLEAMNFNDVNGSPTVNEAPHFGFNPKKGMNLQWVNDDFNNHKQFVLSPSSSSTTTQSASSRVTRASCFDDGFPSKGHVNNDDQNDPDLGWVNDLLM